MNTSDSDSNSQSAGPARGITMIPPVVRPDKNGTLI